jgi:hypothetical protein
MKNDEPVKRRYDSCNSGMVVRLLLSEEPAIRPTKIGEIILRHSGILALLEPVPYF